MAAAATAISRGLKARAIMTAVGQSIQRAANQRLVAYPKARINDLGSSFRTAAIKSALSPKSAAA